MIPQQTFENYEIFGDNATKTAPDSAKYAAGFQESDVLPAEWMNWAWNKNTKGITDLNAGVTSIEAELGNVVTAGGKTPSKTDNTQVITAIKYLIAQAKAQAILAAHPVGSLYWTSSTENPAVTFGGGTWTQIKDRFVLAAGDSYKQGATGGAATITLTTAQLPSHSHTIAHTHSFTPAGTIAAHTHSFTPAGTIGSHSHSFTPAGTIAEHTHSFTPEGTITINAHTHTLNNHTHSFTPAGTIGSHTHSFTPAGTISEHFHTVTAKGTVASHTHNFDIGSIVSNTWENSPHFAMKYNLSLGESSATTTIASKILNSNQGYGPYGSTVKVNYDSTSGNTYVAKTSTTVSMFRTRGYTSYIQPSFTGISVNSSTEQTTFSGTAGTTGSTTTKFTGTAGTTGKNNGNTSSTIATGSFTGTEGTTGGTTTSFSGTVGTTGSATPTFSGTAGTTGSTTPTFTGTEKETVGTAPGFTGTAGTTGSTTTKFTGTAGTTGSTTTKFTGTAGTTGSTTTKFTGTAGTTGASSATNSGAVGSGSSINKMPPYIVEYCWTRTA